MHSQTKRISYREFRSGHVYAADNPQVDATSSAGLNIVNFVPFTVGRLARFDRLGLYVMTAAASTTARLGIYRGNPCCPSDLLLDAGSVDVSSTGQKEIVIDVFLAPGTWWLASVEQGTGGAIYRSKYGHSPELPVQNAASGVHMATGWYQGTFAGALPATVSPTALNTNAPSLTLRAA